MCEIYARLVHPEATQEIVRILEQEVGS